MNQSANQLLKLLNQKQIDNNELEKLYEQIELINQKGEILLQSLSSDSNENPIEHLLETINQTYDNLINKSKDSINDNQISQSSTVKKTNEFHDHIDEIDVTLNELSELLISSTNEFVSAQPVKLTEQLVDNTIIQTELEKQKISLEQLNSNIQQLKQTITNQEDLDSIKGNIIHCKTSYYYYYFFKLKFSFE